MRNQYDLSRETPPNPSQPPPSTQSFPLPAVIFLLIFVWIILGGPHLFSFTNRGEKTGSGSPVSAQKPPEAKDSADVLSSGQEIHDETWTPEDENPFDTEASVHHDPIIDKKKKEGLPHTDPDPDTPTKAPVARDTGKTATEKPHPFNKTKRGSGNHAIPPLTDPAGKISSADTRPSGSSVAFNRRVEPDSPSSRTDPGPFETRSPTDPKVSGNRDQPDRNSPSHHPWHFGNHPGELLLSGYHLQEDGTVTAAESIRKRHVQAVQRAKQQGIQVLPTIGNGHSADRLRHLLATPERRKQTVDHVLHFLRKNRFDGVHILFGPIHASDRVRLSLFVEELADRLHQRENTLIVSVYPKTSEPGNWSGQQAQDWKRLGRAADRLRIVTPRQGSDGASVPVLWMQKVMEFAKSRVPEDKIEWTLKPDPAVNPSRKSSPLPAAKSEEPIHSGNR